MKTKCRFEQYVMLLAVPVALWMHARIGIAGTLAVCFAACMFITARLWSRWCAWRSAYVDAVVTLALNTYDSTERRHAERVAELSVAIAGEMGFSERKIRLIRATGYLHDIGKHIKDDIVDDRWHVAKVADLVSHLPILSETADWIRHHHTWHNGVSCLASLAMAKVPIEAAILAVAEHFDTATCGDTESAEFDNAVDDVRRRTGTQFHPAVVKAFLAVMLRQSPQSNSASTSSIRHQPI